jgi:hypothetical protein
VLGMVDSADSKIVALVAQVYVQKGAAAVNSFLGEEQAAQR